MYMMCGVTVISAILVNVHHRFVNADVLVHVFNGKALICIYARIVDRGYICKRKFQPLLEGIHDVWQVACSQCPNKTQPHYLLLVKSRVRNFLVVDGHGICWSIDRLNSSFYYMDLNQVIVTPIS
jgi:hypothetical protein